MESIGGSGRRRKGCERRKWDGMGMDGNVWIGWMGKVEKSGAWSKQKFEAHAVVSNRYKYPRREDWGEKPQTDDEERRGEMALQKKGRRPWIGNGGPGGRR